MIYFIMVFLIVSIIIVVFSEKKIVNPIVLFAGIWLISIFLSSLKLYNMIDYSEKAIRIISEGIIAFIIGAFMMMYIAQKKYKSYENKKNNEFLNNRVLFILINMSLVMVLILSIKVAVLLKNGVNYNGIRKLYYSYGDGSLISNEKIFTLFDWTTSMVITLTTPTIIVGIINKKVNKLLVFEYVIMVSLYTFSTSGRSVIFVIAIELVLTLLLNKEKLNKKIKILSKIFLIISLILIILMTAIRTSNVKNKNVNTFYAYFSLPLPYFSKLVDYIDNQDVNTYGVATAYGPYLLVQKGFKIITGYKFSKAENLADIITKPQTYWVRVFEDTTDYYNAYSTMFYNFYLDFKDIGVIGISFFYGMFMEFVYQKAKYQKTMKENVLYLIFANGVIKSFASWQFATPAIILALLVLNILFKERKQKDGKSIGIWNDRESRWS